MTESRAERFDVRASRPFCNWDRWDARFDRGYPSAQRKTAPSDAIASNQVLFCLFARNRVPQAGNRSRSQSDSGKGVARTGELRVGVGADRGDCGNADDDDQSQHDSVFNSGRAIFRHQEVFDTLQHDGVPSL